MFEMFWESDGNRQLVQKAVAIRGPEIPSDAELADTMAEIRARVDLKDRLTHPYPQTIDMMVRNAAVLTHWLKSQGRPKAELQADVDQYIKPALRGVMVYIEHNSDGENSSIYRPMEQHLSDLLDAIVDLADPAYTPAA